MELGVIIDKLTERRWIALLLIGAALFLAAGAKEIWGLKIEDSWRVAIAVLAVMPIGLGIWDAFRRTDPTERDLQKDYGFKITVPGDNAHVANEFELEGTYETKPPDNITIRCFIFSVVSGSYWTSSRPIVFNEAAKRWSVTMRLGGAIGDKKLAGVALLGKNAEVICRYYDAVTERVMGLRREFNADIGIPGIPGMPRDWKECAKITIRRTS